jgi:hypothetical protein
MNFTHGGLPESKAWHWNHETYQKLGHIVYLLTSGDQRERQTGYCEYFAMRRQFMSKEWDDQIKRIDEFREEKGHCPLSDLAHRAGQCLVKRDPTPPAEAANRVMPEYSQTEHSTIENPASVTTAQPIECEQLSLF